jgi:hypothetical protein
MRLVQFVVVQFPGLALLVGVNNIRAYLIRSDKLHATICPYHRLVVSAVDSPSALC